MNESETLYRRVQYGKRHRYEPVGPCVWREYGSDIVHNNCGGLHLIYCATCGKRIEVVEHVEMSDTEDE